MLRLSPGEETVMLKTSTAWQLSNLRWHCGLFWIVIPFTVTSKLPKNLRACLQIINRNEVINVSSEGCFGHYAISWMLRIIGQVRDKKVLMVASTRLRYGIDYDAYRWFGAWHFTI